MQNSFKVLPDDHRVSVPPDPFSNSEVKRYIADGSVGFPHVRVGHRQALILRKAHPYGWAFFFWIKAPLTWLNPGLLGLSELVLRLSLNAATAYRLVVDLHLLAKRAG